MLRTWLPDLVSIFAEQRERVPYSIPDSKTSIRYSTRQMQVFYNPPVIFLRPVEHLLKQIYDILGNKWTAYSKTSIFLICRLWHDDWPCQVLSQVGKNTHFWEINISVITAEFFIYVGNLWIWAVNKKILKNVINVHARFSISAVAS